jgi:asparagine synthase (glutamine-hydrolysing)
MCGICGVYNFNRDEAVRPEVLQAMNRQLFHRGPDDEGRYIAQNVGLAMRRLSIVDLKSGQQPLSNEDGTAWIVFNGEIYNHAELRTDLETRGHRYHTYSDTETIIHLYEEYGEDCVQHLRGMFAFAIWDSVRQRLFCARDRFGIKPFYYLIQDRRLLFASEIKALLQFPTVKAELNTNAIPEYLTFGYLTGSQTLFAGIQRLEPGHWLTADARGTERSVRFWDLPQRENRPERSFEKHVCDYRELLEQTVSSHLMSDVPLGMLLSGGLDSSVVAAVIQKRQKDSIRTFSVGYPELESSELPMARRVAQHLGTEHHEVKLSAENFFRALPGLIWHEDEPLAWPSSVPLYFVCRRARENVKVVLTGEGSDETLAGYDRYAWTLYNKRADTLYRHLVPDSARRWIATEISRAGWLDAPSRRKMGHTFLGRDGRSIKSLYFDNFYAAFSGKDQIDLLMEGLIGDPYQGSLDCWEESAGNFLARLLHFDLKTYLVELLMKQDNMSMAASIESRVPYLDHMLAECALQIPVDYQISGFAGKQVLKTAAKDLLPKDVIEQRKRGFPTPWRTWLTSEWIDGMESLLLAPRSQMRKILRPAAVHRLFLDHRNGVVDNSDRIWRLLNLELWHRVFVDDDPTYRRSTDDQLLPEFAHPERGAKRNYGPTVRIPVINPMPNQQSWKKLPI